MVKYVKSALWVVALFMLLVVINGCVTTRTTGIIINPSTPEEYELACQIWGKKHYSMGLKADRTDSEFVRAIIDDLNFFWVHSDLKEACRRGYRLGYQDRTADLVLGPHLTEAAARIGTDTAVKFVNVIEKFESGWSETLQRAIDVFIVLISEGSQADRLNFIDKFTEEYSIKWRDTENKLKDGYVVQQLSEGKTLLYLDPKTTYAVLTIPSSDVLKGEIYYQTFRVMGDEWGRRYSHNMIKRAELVDLFRRSKTALQEFPLEEPSHDVRLRNNLCVVYRTFNESYGADADYAFRDLTSEAGLSDNTASFERCLQTRTRAEPVTAQTGSKKIVTIRSNVWNDNVIINGVGHGSTPFVLHVVEGYRYDVTITRLGFTSSERTLIYENVSDGEHIHMNLTK